MNKVAVAVPDRPDTRVIRLYFTRLAWRWGYFDVHRGAISIVSGVFVKPAQAHRYAPHR
jgi:hypothetical protein